MAVKTDIDVCNAGLSKLGQFSIDGFDDTTDLAAICSRIYPIVRDSLLSRHEWRFATIMRQLARDADETPKVKYGYAYRLPADLIDGPNAVYEAGGRNPVKDFQLVGQFIYTDLETVVIEYRARAAENIWPAWFEDLVVEATAAALAMPVTETLNKAQYHNQIAFGLPSDNGEGGLYSQARRLDSKSKVNKSFIPSSGGPLIEARG